MLCENRFLAVSASLLFLIHPLQTEVVNYVSHRTELLMVFFFLLSFIGYYWYVAKKQFCIVGLIVSLICYVGALLSKEMGMSAPLFFLMYLYCRSLFSKRTLVALIPYGIIFISYCIVRSTALNFTQASLTQYTAGVNLGVLPLSIAQITVRYLRLFIFPFDLHMERDIPVVYSWLNMRAWLSVSVIVLCVLLFLRLQKNIRYLLFGGLWALIAYLPVANFIPLQMAIAEHYMYLPSIGVFIMVGACMRYVIS